MLRLERRAKTLGLHIIGLSKGKTETSELTIQTKSGLKKYDVGALEISVIEDTSDKPLEVGNFYPIIRDEKNYYIYSLQNKGSDKIVVNKFDAELNGETVSSKQFRTQSRLFFLQSAKPIKLTLINNEVIYFYVNWNFATGLSDNNHIKKLIKDKLVDRLYSK